MEFGCCFAVPHANFAVVGTPVSCYFTTAKLSISWNVVRNNHATTMDNEQKNQSTPICNLVIVVGLIACVLGLSGFYLPNSLLNTPFFSVFNSAAVLLVTPLIGLITAGALIYKILYIKGKIRFLLMIFLLLALTPLVAFVIWLYLAGNA